MLASLLLASALPPLAPQDQRDLNCLAVYLMVGSMPEFDSKPELKTGISANVMYYIGRIEGRNPDFPLEERLTALVQDSNFIENDFPIESKRCGAEMVVRGRALSDMGRSMQERAAPLPGDGSGT